MAALSKPELVRLAFWAQNMVAVRESNFSWPGFSYEKSEWDRMEELAKGVSGGAYVKFLGLNAIVFILFAAIVIVCGFLPVLLLLYPDTRELQALPFTLLLAATAFLTIGFGLPLSMRISAWLCASDKLRQSLSSTLVDERLAARVSWQLMRMTLIMCAILVPGMLLFIAFNIDGGPIVTILKVACTLILLGGIATTATRKRPS